jgi:hypothetical protein
MTTTLEITQTLQDGVLKAVETSQRWTIEAVKASTSAFDGLTPDYSWLPMADLMPAPQAAIDQTFSFASKLLEAQRRFLLELASAAPAAPVTPAAKKA